MSAVMQDQSVDGAQPGDGFDGLVEQLDEARGVSGWAIDRADPSRPVEVELVAGNDLLASTFTGVSRRDVTDTLGVDAQPGFRFPADAVEAMRSAARSGATGELSVRIAGSTTPLPSALSPITLEMVRLAAGGASARNHDDLLHRLTAHIATAEQQLDEVRRPDPEHVGGFVETMATDEAGLLWVGGWMRSPEVFDQSVVLLDGRKYAAGFAYACGHRADLPPGAVSFVGVLQTDWRPAHGSHPFVFLSSGAPFFLQSVQPLRIMPQGELGSWILGVLGICDSGYTGVLRDLLLSARSWAPTPGELTGNLVAVDEALVLPGFGVILVGWGLSPTRELAGLILNTGNRTYVADAETLTRISRRDLVDIYPGADRSIERAGFIAAFLGRIDDSRVSSLTLKAVWDDGSATNLRVEPRNVRILGATAPLERIQLHYPAVAAEPFFAGFATAAGESARARARHATPFAAPPMSAALICAVPAARSDLFLLAEQLRRHAGDLGEEQGIVLLARADDNRAAIVTLFDDLRDSVRRPCALFFVPDLAGAVHALDTVIDALGLLRFVFVGGGTILRDAGWRAAGMDSDGLTLFEIADPTGADGEQAALGLDAFASSATDWRWLASRLPATLDGLGAVDVRNGAAATVADAAWSLSSGKPTPFRGRINAAIVAAHG